MRRPAVLFLPLLSMVGIGCALRADAASSAVTDAPSKHQAAPNLLSEENFTIKSLLQVDLDKHTATFVLHKGYAPDLVTPVWFIITDTSDFGLAHDLNINYAPKLANMPIGCPHCVQDVDLLASPGTKFGEAKYLFKGIPDFSPTRILDPGPTGFPPLGAQPGSVGDELYTPFIRFPGSDIVYNAPIVAVGDGPFDVTTHTDTLDRTMAINTDPAKMTVDMLMIKGFDSGKPILYLTTEASDPVAAVLERATFVPLLNHAPFLGGDDFLGSARERIFPFTNGQTGADNPEAQGLSHAILDGHGTEDANLENTALIDALANGDGDSLNIQGDFPSLLNPRFANAYSPLWDAQLSEWTPEAIAKGVNTRQNDENTVLQLVVQGLITGPGGSTFGAGGFVINCPVLAFLEDAPQAPQAADPFAPKP